MTVTVKEPRKKKGNEKSLRQQYMERRKAQARWVVELEKADVKLARSARHILSLNGVLKGS